MLQINMADVMNVLGSLTPYLIAIGVLFVLALIITFAVNWKTVKEIATRKIIHSESWIVALVGIVVAKSSGEDVEGLGFAIPINDAKPIIEDLIAQGYVGGRVSLGVTALDLTSPQLAAQYGYKTPGVYVQSVVENSSAAAGGLQPGDCFVSINGTAIEAISDVTTILNDSSVGDQLEVTVKRDGKIVELSITLQEKKG